MGNRAWQRGPNGNSTSVTSPSVRSQREILTVSSARVLYSPLIQHRKGIYCVQGIGIDIELSIVSTANKRFRFDRGIQSMYKLNSQKVTPLIRTGQTLRFLQVHKLPLSHLYGFLFPFSPLLTKAQVRP